MALNGYCTRREWDGWRGKYSRRETVKGWWASQDVGYLQQKVLRERPSDSFPRRRQASGGRDHVIGLTSSNKVLSSFNSSRLKLYRSTMAMLVTLTYGPPLQYQVLHQTSFDLDTRILGVHLRHNFVLAPLSTCALLDNISMQLSCKFQALRTEIFDIDVAKRARHDNNQNPAGKC